MESSVEVRSVGEARLTVGLGLALCSEREIKSRPLVDLSFGPDGTAVPTHNSFHRRQSDAGAGLELRGQWPRRDEEFILLRFVAPSIERPVTMCAALRHRAITDAGTLRVGVEFVNAPVPEPGQEWGWRSPMRLRGKMT